MDCRSSILVDNERLFVMIHTNADYTWKRDIPFRQWIGLWRYEIIFRINGVNKVRLNYDCKTGLKITNAIHRAKAAIKCFFGRHLYFADSNECYHCKHESPNQ